MKTTFDVIVAGVGGMGSSALYHLAKAGHSVCGIERFQPGHDRGSTHGDSRIVRKAYFLDPSYVPLMHRSYELIADLEARRKEKLFYNVGLLSAGVIDSPFHRGMEKCFATHNLPHERWNVAETALRFPFIRLPEDSVVYYDPSGGYGNPEAFVVAHVRNALEEGAELLLGERMLSWRTDGSGVEVKTETRTLRAAKLILTTGAWVAPELVKLGVNIVVKRKVQVWFQVAHIELFKPEVCPVFILKNRSGDFYGFPTLDGSTVKTAETSGGTPLASADDQHGRLLPADYENLAHFMRNTFGDLVGPHVAHKECLQTFTDDQNFIVDRHPDAPQVTLCSACSGHGFKFTPVLGEILGKMATEKKVDLDMGLFRLSRFLGLNRGVLSRAT